MSAKALREVAQEIRTDVSATDRWAEEDVAFVLAVADWLDGVAGRFVIIPGAHQREACDVARAYLGDPS